MTIGEAVLFLGPLTWSGVTDEGNGPFQQCWPAFIEGFCTGLCAIHSVHYLIAHAEEC